MTKNENPVDDILDYVAKTCFDHYHGMSPSPKWVIPAVPLLGLLRSLTGQSRNEFADRFDAARKRVYGEAAINKLDAK